MASEEMTLRELLLAEQYEARIAELEAALRAIISRCDDPEGMSADNIVDTVRHRAAVALGLEE